MNGEPGDNEHTLLTTAVHCGNVEIVKVLIEAGADVNTTKPESLLVTAVRDNKVEIVKVLINAGADVNSSCCKNDPHSLLGAAIEQGNNDLVD